MPISVSHILPWFYRVLNWVLILLLAWLVAGLVWWVLAPASLPPVAAPVQVEEKVAEKLDTEPLVRLFGGLMAGEPPMTTLNIKLRGLIGSATAADEEKAAVGLFDLAGQSPLAVKTGDEVMPNVYLLSVGKSFAIIDNNGRRERVNLDVPALIGAELIVEDGKAPARGNAAKADNKLILPVEPLLPNATGTTGTFGTPAGINPATDDGIKVLQRKTLVAGLQGMNVSSWVKGLADFEKGGVLIEDANAQPLAAKLNLQNGDILKAVNGRNLTRKGDISVLYDTFGSTSLVELSIVRGASPLTLRYRIE